MTRNKIIGGILAAAFLGLVLWAVLSVPKPPEQTDAQQRPRIMSYEDNTLHEEQDGRTVWTLTAQNMSVDIDTQDTTMKGIEGTFYSEDGNTLSLKADTGHMDSTTHDVVLTGGIYAETSNGVTLRANALHWTAAKKELAAEGSAVLTRDDLRASGDRITSADEFEKFAIEGNAHIIKGRDVK